MLLSGLDDIATWHAVIEAEPALAVVLSGERVDAALLAIANFVDLKSPYFLGHADAVAQLAAEAGARLGLNDAEVRLLRRAGLVHDLGRLGVSNAIWDKRGPLGAGEWERVRLQPYITERMLRQSEALAPMAAIAVQHRELARRLGLPAGALGRRDFPVRSRAWCRRRLPGDARAASAPRSARADEAAGQLRTDVKAGRRRRRGRRSGAERGRPPRPKAVGRTGGSYRARGRGPQAGRARPVEQGNRRRLVISPKTAANHVEHIYSKIDTSTRAAASLFAMQQGLLPDEELPARVTG